MPAEGALIRPATLAERQRMAAQSDQLDNGAFNASRALANQAVSTAQQILAFDRGKNPNKKQGKGS